MTARANRIGAFALALTDRMREEVEAASGLTGETAAALLVIAQAPGGSVEDLRRAVGRSHPATVRIVDRLVERGLVARGAGSRGPTLALTATPAGRARAREALAARARVVDDLGADASAALDRALARLAAVTACRLCDKSTCRRGDDCPVVERLTEQGVVIGPSVAP